MKASLRKINSVHLTWHVNLHRFPCNSFWEMF